MLRREENFYYLALPGRNCFMWGNETGNTGSNAPSCPLGYPIRTQNSPHLARSLSLAVCINMFWARLRLIIARAVRRGLKWALRRAQNGGPQFWGGEVEHGRPWKVKRRVGMWPSLKKVRNFNLPYFGIIMKRDPEFNWNDRKGYSKNNAISLGSEIFFCFKNISPPEPPASLRFKKKYWSPTFG